MLLTLGRLYKADSRDADYPIWALIQPLTLEPRVFRYWWDNGGWFDQGNTPSCVGHAWVHWLEDGPITQFPKAVGTKPITNPNHVYREAQKVDEWPGESYDGTSIRAGAKVLQHKRLLTAYHWAWDLQTLIDTVLHLGPVVVGTNWYMNMFEPKDGIVKVGGPLAGGHAWVINGVNTQTGLFRAKNSWGRKWGVKGRFYISFDDMTRLIRENGEICIATERQRPIDEPPV